MFNAHQDYNFGEHFLNSCQLITYRRLRGISQAKHRQAIVLVVRSRTPISFPQERKQSTGSATKDNIDETKSHQSDNPTNNSSQHEVFLSRMSFAFVLTEKPLTEAIWPVRFDVARKLPLAYYNIINTLQDICKIIRYAPLFKQGRVHLPGVVRFLERYELKHIFQSRFDTAKFN